MGHEPESPSAMLRIPLVKGSRLQAASDHLADCYEVNTEVVRSSLGIWIWGALLCRELLSIPHAIFVLACECGGQCR